MIVSKITPPPDAIVRPASQLAVGDRIAARFLPTRDPATIVFVLPYKLAGRDWVYLTHRDGEHAPEPSWFKAEEPIWLESVAAPSGLSYSREPESTVVTPVPAGVEGHAEGTRAVVCLPECVASTPLGLVRRHHVDCPVLAAAAEQVDN